MYSTEHLIGTVEPIVRQAGAILMAHFGKPMAYREKPGSGQSGTSLVTEADLASEKLLISEIGRAFPDAAFFAEESGAIGAKEYCFVIDPLDGTTNFVHGLPYFCISVALTLRGEPIFGMIYNPILNEMYYAYKGQGAYLNGKKLEVTQEKQFSKAVCVVGLPYAKGQRYMALLEMLKEISPKLYTFRHFGAAALDLAYVARGSLDGVFLADLGWWDVAAGTLLIEEAGGKATDFEGKIVRSDFNSVVAGSKPMHSHLKELLKESFRV